MKNNIKIMSFNIRCKTTDDTGERNWENRKKLIKTIIEDNNPSIICFQEVRKDQYEFLSSIEKYNNINQYRDNSPLSESNPIFFDKSLFTLLDSKTFWLSNTPQTMSKDWNSKCYRICTMALLKHTETDKKLIIMNTHLDHKSEEARLNGIKLIISEIKKHNLPVFLMGDFNAEPDENTIEFANENLINTAFGFEDFNKPTFNGYEKTDIEKHITIDYIFTNKNNFAIKNFKVIDSTFDNVLPSDHFSIMCKVELQ